jgi:hypothetical protein
VLRVAAGLRTAGVGPGARDCRRLRASCDWLEG